MIKNLIVILILILLNQCGYTPVYKGKTKSDISISLINMEGDKEFNYKINSKLRKYYNNNSENNYLISVKSSIENNTITKDSKGKTTNYEIIATARFKISYKGEDNFLVLKENLKIEYNDDSFEQKKYEDTIKNNFASSMIEKLIIKLNTLE